MPALGMAQEVGRLIAWLKMEGDQIIKGEPIMEIETDKATVEIEAPATGVLSGVSVQEGEEVPVGHITAWILAPGESTPEEAPEAETAAASADAKQEAFKTASPVAQRMAAEHNIDISQIKTDGGRVEKADVLAYIEEKSTKGSEAQLISASPKARRLAQEYGLDLATLNGSGPEGAILADDVLTAISASKTAEKATAPSADTLPITPIWQRMMERMTQSWGSAPHFYLQREVNASRMVVWRKQVQDRTDLRITYTDLLVKLVASALRQHPRVNAAWHRDEILLKNDINIGLAVAIEDGLIVPVIHQADKLGLLKIAERRAEMIRLVKNGNLSLDDLQDGTFTISNLGMFGVDVFNAVLNPPQAALLSIGRIADRVVSVDGRPAVQPTLILSMSFDHRVVDGARGGAFLETLATLIEEPLQMLE